MVTQEQRAILIQAGEHSPQSGVMRVTCYDKGDRIKRALKSLALFWILAALSVPIILAHFVLVPGFLIAGPIVAYLKYHAHMEPQVATGPCPACQKEITLALETNDVLPKWTYCPACAVSIQLRLAEK